MKLLKRASIKRKEKIREKWKTRKSNFRVMLRKTQIKKKQILELQSRKNQSSASTKCERK